MLKNWETKILNFVKLSELQRPNFFLNLKDINWSFEHFNLKIQEKLQKILTEKKLKHNKKTGLTTKTKRFSSKKNFLFNE